MNFKWMNESEISIEGDRIEITAPPKTDFFLWLHFYELLSIEHKTVKNIRSGKQEMNIVKKNDYHKTKIACYMGFITQAIAANFAPLLFVTCSHHLNHRF